jgi:hypothetical protein
MSPPLLSLSPRPYGTAASLENEVPLSLLLSLSLSLPPLSLALAADVPPMPIATAAAGTTVPVRMAPNASLLSVAADNIRREALELEAALGPTPSSTI